MRASFVRHTPMKSLKHSMVSRIMVMGFGFLTHVLLARFVTKDTFGQLYLLTSSLAILSTVVMHGRGGLLVREIPKALVDDDANRLWGLVLSSLRDIAVVMLLVFTGFVFLAPYCFRLALDIDISNMLVLLSCVLLTVLVFQRFVSDALRGFHRVGDALTVGNPSAPGTAGYGLIACVSFVVVLCIMSPWYRPFSVELLIACMIPGSLLGLLWGTTRLSRALGQHKRLPLSGSVMLKGIVASSLPFAFLGLLKVSSTYLESWLVGSLLSVEQVATIGLASRCASLMFTPIVVMQTASLSFVAEIHARKAANEHRKELQGVSLVCLGFLSCAVIALCVAPSSLYTFIFGADYSNLGWITCLRMIQFSAYGLSGLAFALLTMSQFTGVACVLLALNLVVKVVCESVGAHLWGLSGMLYFGIGVDLAYSIALVITVRRLFGFWLVPRYHRGVLLGLRSRR